MHKNFSLTLFEILQENKRNYKPVGGWISTPSPTFVAMATRVSHEVQWIADFLQTGAELPIARPRVVTSW